MEKSRNSDNTQRKRRWIGLLALCLLVLTGAAFRLHHLGDKALWLDEIFTLVRTHQAGPLEIMERVMTNERHPPLFHLLSAPLLRPGHGDAAVRVVPALASTLTILLTGLLAWRAFGRNAGLAAAALTAFSSFEVVTAQEGRPAALATLLLLASTLLFHRAVFGERGRGATWATTIYGLTVALALHTYYYAAYLVAAQMLFLLALGAARVRGSRSEESRFRVFGQGCHWPVLLAGSAGGLLVLPWALWARESLIRFSTMASTKEAVNYGPLAAADYFRALYVFPLKFSATWLNWSLAALVLAQLAAALLISRTRERRFRLLAVLLLFLPLAAVIASPFKPELFQPRHLAYLSPVFFILLARLVTVLRPRWIAALLVVGFLALNIFSLQLYFDLGYRKTAVRDCTAAIASSARPGDAVLFNPAFASHSYERYEAGEPLPKIIVYPGEFDRLKGELHRYRRVWLVEYRGATFGPLPSYDATVRRTFRPAGGRRTFTGVNEAITVSLFVNPEAWPSRPTRQHTSEIRQ
jgi:uncharacterized membrane protein